MTTDDETRVAIACQGGGSHTAFTAGVLTRLLREDRDYEIVGFSGTSGGAICALLAWYGLLHDAYDPAEILLEFWEGVKAEDPFDRATNTSMLWAIQLRAAGIPIPEISPFWNPSAHWGQDHLRKLLKSTIDFDAVSSLATEEGPGLMISAIEVQTGRFEIFREDEVTPETILASSADPNLFDAVDLGGKKYWDGLFSKNPPVQDFNVAADLPDPDEVWVIKINPQERERVPKSLNGILDRRNELSGNLSLNAETRFIEQVNRWIEQGHLPERYTHTELHRIRLQRKLDWTTKLDRNPAFLDDLIDEGRDRGTEFLDGRS
jgi:NTE family protein